MFSLHETSKKRLCRAAFVLCCLAPTAGTLSWSVHRWCRGSDAAWQQRLSSALLLPTRVSRAVEARPGLWRIGAARCFAGRSQQPAAELVDLQCDLRAARPRVAVRQATLDLAALPALIAAAWQWRAGTHDSAEWFVSELRLRVAASPADANAPHAAPPTELVARAVRLRWETQPQADGPCAVLALQADFAGDEGASASRLQLAWQRPLAGEGGDAIRLEASEPGVSAAILGPLAPGLAQLAAARFAGAVQWRRTGQTAGGTLEGTLHAAPLAAFLPADSPHRIDGVATIQLAACRWQHDRWESCAGRLQKGQGCFSRSFWQSAVDRLHCLPPPQASGTPQLLPHDALVFFDELACEFQFDRQGLVLASTKPLPEGAEAAPLVLRHGEPILCQRRVRLPAGAWLQLWELTAPSWLPATRAAVETAQRLPLP
jgi:hypothetical protein